MKKNRSLKKDSLRTIKNSLGRYLAIVIMIMLSVMIFIGLKHASPNLKNSVENRAKSHNMHNIKIHSYAGLRDKDKKIIEATENLKDVEYYFNKLMNISNSDKKISLYSLTSKIDTYKLVDGYLPTNKTEIALDSYVLSPDYQGEKYKLGDYITLDNQKNEMENNIDILTNTKFKIVGFVDSINFVIKSRNNTDSGEAFNFFALVSKDAFKVKYEDFAILTTKSLASLDPKSEDYKLKEEKEVSNIKYALKDRPRIIKENLLNNAKDKISSGEKEVIDAEKNLDTAQMTLVAAKKELDVAEKKISDGWKTYNDNKKLYQDKINDGQNKLDQGFQQLTRAKDELKRADYKYKEGLVEYENKIADGQKKLDQTNKVLKAKKEELDKQNLKLNNEKKILEDKLKNLTNEKLSLEDKIKNLKYKIKDLKESTDKPTQDIKEIINQLEKELEKLNKNIDTINISIEQTSQTLTHVNQNIKTLDIGLIEYKNGLAEYNKQVSKFITEKKNAKQKLDKAIADINSGKNEITYNEKNLYASQDQLNKEKISGYEKLKKARLDLEDAQNKYQDGLKVYENKKNKFEAKKDEANANIIEAKKDIDIAKNKLDDIEIPLYQITGRYNNQIYSLYMSQADGLETLTIFFTGMFFLVSILVSLTSLLRMVEMERIQIGTLKALGYSSKNILSKYLTYGVSSSLIGSLLGIPIGYFLLVKPILKSYLSETNINISLSILNWKLAIIIIIVSIGLISLTTYLAVKAELKENSASLMRPKPPKETKKTIFEKIPFIWKRLSFLNKVAIRNVVRHKIRIFMTIIGIAGSFSLISLGFGIKYSVGDVSIKQFKNIYKFDAQIYYDKSIDDYKSLEKSIKDNSKSYLSIISSFGSIIDENDLSEDVEINAIDKNKSYKEFIVLQNRLDKNELILDDNKVIITEKLALNLNKNIGDKITFLDGKNIGHTLVISGITEQYFSHKIYMTKDLYKKELGSQTKDNQFLILAKNHDELQSLETKLSSYKSNLAFINASEMQKSLDSLRDSLNIIVIIIIGISAILTFVVLYNLTTINISERSREISTIKVLGFRPNELLSYIFKENIALLIIGFAFGSLLGKIMHQYIIFKLSPQSFLFDPHLRYVSYLYSALIVTLFTLVVIAVSSKNIKKLDMVEALKAVD